jgi:predicted esterase
MVRSTARALVAAGILLLTACGGDDEASGTRTTRPTTSTWPTTTTAPPAFEPLPSPRTRRLEYQPGVYLQLVEPDACADGPRPAMVTLGSRLAFEFAARGYLGVIVEARNPGYEQRFDARIVRAIGSVVHDMAIAVQWLRAHADEHCVEPDAIAATGYSFAALAALALAYSEGEEPGGEITIDEFGTTVAVEPVEHGLVPAELVPFSNDLDAVVSFAGFALAAHLDRGEPPVILFHGRDDQTVPFSLAEQTCAAAQAVGVTCELVPLDDGHALPMDLSDLLDKAEQFLDREMLTPAGLTDE